MSIYLMKQRSGVDITIVRATTNVDLKTGDYNITTVQNEIRAVFVSNLSKYVHIIQRGGDVEIGDAIFITDELTKELERDDYIIYRGKRYNVIQQDYLDDEFYLIARSTQEERKDHVVTMTFRDRLTTRELGSTDG